MSFFDLLCPGTIFFELLVVVRFSSHHRFLTAHLHQVLHFLTLSKLHPVQSFNNWSVVLSVMTDRISPHSVSNESTLSFLSCYFMSSLKSNMSSLSLLILKFLNIFQSRIILAVVLKATSLNFEQLLVLSITFRLSSLRTDQ